MISATPGREVRQELYLNHRYEKARQDVGLFYLKKQNQYFSINFKNSYNVDYVHFRKSNQTLGLCCLEPCHLNDPKILLSISCR